MNDRHPPVQTPATTRGFWHFFDEDNHVREGQLLSMGLVLALASIGICGLACVLFPGRGGPRVSLVAVAASLYCLLRLMIWRRNGPVAFMRDFGIFALVPVPALMLVVVALNGEARLAFSSWLPAQLWLIIITFSMLRMKVWQPVCLALAAAVSYASVAVICRQLDDEYFRWSSIIMRSSTIIIWGALASFAATRMRTAIVRASQRLRESDLFGKYRLGDKIASGGMGTVSKATYCPEGGFVRDVAIKRIHEHLASDEKTLQRFRTEAEYGARLMHQNIVTTLDYGSANGTYFMAMEFIDGDCLKTLRCNAGPSFPARLVAHVGREICRGLHFAHVEATDASGQALRVVHGDLCPNNIMVTRGGHVKVADFGVAIAMRDAPHVTPGESVVGKPCYLSPEQIKRKPYDARADLFTVGAVLHELLTGARVFQRDNQAATLYAVVDGDRAQLDEYRSDLSNAWEDFFDRALNPHASKRFQNAREMAVALAALEGTAVAAVELANFVKDTLDQRESTARSFLFEDTPETMPAPALEVLAALSEDTPLETELDVYDVDTLIAFEDDESDESTTRYEGVRDTVRDQSCRDPCNWPPEVSRAAG